MKFTDICFLTPDVGRLRAFYEAVFQTRSEGDDFHATLSAGGLAFTFALAPFGSRKLRAFSGSAGVSRG